MSNPIMNILENTFWKKNRLPGPRQNPTGSSRQQKRLVGELKP
jgi:hypothetical protein